MSFYCPVEELTSRIYFLSSIFPQYAHKFPILSWNYQNDQDELLRQLTQRGLKARFYKGLYYDSYAEGDYDLCMETNYDNGDHNLTSESTITYTTDIFTKDDRGLTILLKEDRCYFPMLQGPQELRKLSGTMESVPEEQVQILQALYPNSWAAYKFAQCSDTGWEVGRMIPCLT